WPWAGTEGAGGRNLLGGEGARYTVHEASLEFFPGWTVTLLSSRQYDYLSYLRPFFSRNRPLVVPLLGLICVVVVVLYRTGSREVEQRRLAEAALRASEERFRTLYNKTPALLQSVDPAGRLVGVSDYWVGALGYDREEVLGRPLGDFMPEGARRCAEAVMLPELLRTGACKDVACQLRRKDGEVVDVLLSCVAERGPGGEVSGSLSVLADVTEQKRVERELQRAQELLRSHSRELERQVRERTLEITNILRYTPAVVSLKDLEGRYLLVNQRFQELFRVEADAVLGKTAREVFPAEVAARFEAHERETVATRTAVSREETIPLPDGLHTHLLVKFPLFDEGGRVTRVGSIATDVTALKQAQERLRQLSNRILQGQERERAAIARELHDELGQVLLALKMDAAWLQKRLAEADPGGAQRAQAMGETVDATIDEVRGIVMRLRPGVLDDLGLVAALGWLAEEFERRTDIPCTFRHSAVPPMDDLAATATYRIAQEALTNVARHAGASQVHLELAAGDGWMVLTVRDDGRGFAAEGGVDRPGRGVTGIRERAALAGGTVGIEVAPGGGTVLTFRLPLADSPAKELP
ncbi:MAG: PAS domain-containing sensor histidine kinase, partial [Deferrisomatales bacterium]